MKQKKLIACWMVLLLLISGSRGTQAGDGTLAPWKQGQSTDMGYFPIAVWLQNPVNAGRYRDIGINLYVGLWQGPTQAQIDTLKRYNMPLICSQNAWARQHLDERLIVAWMHGDEPDNAHTFQGYWQGDKQNILQAWPDLYRDLGLGTKPYKGYGPPIPPQRIIDDYKKLKAVDPGRPVLMNLGQGVAWEGYIGRGERTGKLEDYPEYVRGCDLVSFDVYPACHRNPAVAQKLWFVPRGVDRLRQWGGPQKPVWTCIECTQIQHPTTKATPHQVKCEVWMAIIHGAKGLIYFCHTWKPHFIEAGLLADAKMALAVKDINAQITRLAPVINSPTHAEVATVTASPGDTQIDLMAKRTANAIYLFAVDMKGRATRGRFAIEGVTNAQVEVLDEHRTLSVKDGTFFDDFEAWGVHLYKLTISDN